MAQTCCGFSALLAPTSLPAFHASRSFARESYSDRPMTIYSTADIGLVTNSHRKKSRAETGRAASSEGNVKSDRRSDRSRPNLAVQVGSRRARKQTLDVGAVQAAAARPNVEATSCSGRKSQRKDQCAYATSGQCGRDVHRTRGARRRCKNVVLAGHRHVVTM